MSSLPIRPVPLELNFHHLTEIIFEYVRGHTGLRCQNVKYHVTKPLGNEDVILVATSEQESAATSPHPGALFMESISISLAATCVRTPYTIGLPIGPIMVDPLSPEDQLDIEVVDQGGISQITCRFAYILPGGSPAAPVIRTFMFRNGMIHRII